MKSYNRYDERQRMEQGKIFQQSFILLLLIMLINASFQEITGFFWADYYDGQLILLMIAACYASIRMIWKDAYNDVNSSRINPVVIVFGVAGLCGIYSNLRGMFILKMGFASQGKLTANGTGTIIAGCMLLICIVHLVKYLKDKKTDRKEDEES